MMRLVLLTRKRWFVNRFLHVTRCCFLEIRRLLHTFANVKSEEFCRYSDSEMKIINQQKN